MHTPFDDEGKAARILAAITLIEGAWVALNAAHKPHAFIGYLGFATNLTGRPAGWFSWQRSLRRSSFATSANSHRCASTCSGFPGSSCWRWAWLLWRAFSKWQCSGAC